MSELRLTYCGNVHAAEDLDQWLVALDRYAVPVGAVQPGSFGLGVWWNARCASTLATDPLARERVAERLSQLGLSIWTLNVFPCDSFHAAVVKRSVYRPSWAEARRLSYTLQAAEAVAALVPAGSVIPLSTLPLGFGSGDLREMANALRRAARALAELEARSGVCCALALEPEPSCLLETTAQTTAFLENWVFARAAGNREREDLLRRHLGICVDLCHLAVVGEEPVQALGELVQRGVAVSKIQVSACLELRDGSALDQLLAFDEPRYLHQTASDDGLRALDLDEVRARRDEFGVARRLRTHFHVPVFWDTQGPLGSTRAEVEHVLRNLRSPYPVLEVETYTWGVLDRTRFGAEDLVAGLRHELSFVRQHLQSTEQRPPDL